jgi:hypothetical protein
MLANIVTNLAGQIQSQQGTIEHMGLSLAMQQPSIAAPDDSQPAAIDGAPAPQPQIEQPQIEQQAGTMMTYPNSGMPSQDEIDAQQQGGMPQPMQDVSGQEQGYPLQDGMNTQIDPAILDTLAQIKDSSTMDVGIISLLANNDSMVSIVGEYSPDILNGASAIGRILLNAMVKKNQMIQDVGEKKYGQVIKNMKTVFVKMSDLYADILKMELESDGKVEN